MKNILSLIILLCLASCGGLKKSGQGNASSLTPKPIATESNNYPKRKVLMGSAFNAWTMTTQDSVSQVYRSCFDELFTVGVPENIGKMWYMRDNLDPDIYNFGKLDPIADWLNERNKVFKFHALAWDVEDRLPRWYDKLNSTEKLKALELHIKTIVHHFSDKVTIYDVANHPVLNGPYPDALRPHNERKNWMGIDLPQHETIAKCLRWTYESNPNAELVINEGFLQNDLTRKSFIELVSNTIAYAKQEYSDTTWLENVGIGWMCHIGHPMPPDDYLLKAFDDLNGLNLNMHITEFDFSYKNYQSELHKKGGHFDPEDSVYEYSNWWDYQAYNYTHFYDLALRYPRMKSIIMWGFWDQNHWKSTTQKGKKRGAGLFWDHNFYKKPVYHSMRPLLTVQQKKH